MGYLFSQPPPGFLVISISILDVIIVPPNPVLQPKWCHPSIDLLRSFQFFVILDNAKQLYVDLFVLGTSSTWYFSRLEMIILAFWFDILIGFQLFLQVEVKALRKDRRINHLHVLDLTNKILPSWWRRCKQRWRNFRMTWTTWSSKMRCQLSVPTG